MVSLLTCTHCFCSLTVQWKSLPGENITSFKKALSKSIEHPASWRPPPWCLINIQSRPRSFFSHLGKFHSVPTLCNNFLLFLIYSMDVIILSKWNQRRCFLNQPIYLIWFKKYIHMCFPEVSNKYLKKTHPSVCKTNDFLNSWSTTVSCPSFCLQILC